MVALAILLIIFILFVIAYVVYRSYRVKSPETKVKREKKCKEKESIPDPNAYETPVSNSHIYESAENGQTTYTALKRPEERDDDHVYARINKVQSQYVNVDDVGK